ncbi:MAG TPA: hypothetical protein VEB20_10380 [Azospirillaceae bacterium]|nr:hypothetical protein [Azospirillaceae bacterium]
MLQPRLDTDLWTAADVAKHLKIHVDTFYAKRRQLEAQGFPPPVPGYPRRLWDPAAIRLHELEQQGLLPKGDDPRSRARRESARAAAGLPRNTDQLLIGRIHALMAESAPR